MAFWSAIGPVAKLIDTVASWALDEEGLGEWKKRREGDKLAAEFQRAHKEWRKWPNQENKKVRDEALAALNRWSDAP